MPDDTHETAPTQFVQSGDVRFAYRRFGPRGATPLLLCNYFAANMDDWDPKVTNGFAAEHDVILFDNPGIGRSPGETPSTVAALTKHCVAFCRAIGLTQFDVIGFSLGGMMAQQLGAEYPDLLRRIILLGTGPRGGEGMVFDDLSVDELDDTSALLMKAFFTQSEASQASGRSYIERLKSRNTDRDRPVSKQSALAELAAIREWGVIPASDRFAMLNKIRHPTDCPREQGCRGHADQRIPTGRAPAQCSTDHVSGLQPWCTISARGSLSSACEVVSAVTARSISFWQGEIHS
jgi:pimeloyl-ACP methyl ester carboxylesterase